MLSGAESGFDPHLVHVNKMTQLLCRMAGGIQASGSFKRIFNSSNNVQQHESFAVYRQQQDTMKTGWLFKQGGVIKSWHKRWFVIRGDQLFYYTSQDENKQMGAIFLPGNKVVEMPVNPNEPDKYPFEIQAGMNTFTANRYVKMLWSL